MVASSMGRIEIGTIHLIHSADIYPTRKQLIHISIVVLVLSTLNHLSTLAYHIS